MKIQLVIFIATLSFARSVYADQFHYHDFLIGDRAIGIGGAYVAISDDASGVYYNPAGLSYALSNDVSGSANALYTSSVTYKDAIANRDFTEQSSGNVPSFFGGLQKLDNLLPGLVFAFGIYTDNSDLQDQNTLIENVNLGAPSPCSNGKTRDPFILQRFHRTANERSTTLNIAAGIGYRVHPRFAVGVGLNYFNPDELIQEYQDVREQTNACDSEGKAVDFTTLRTQNIRQHVVGFGLQPMIAFQAILLERLSWGLTIKPGFYMAQSLDQESEERDIQTTLVDQASIDAASASGEGAEAPSAIISEVNGLVKSRKPLGTPALEVRTGLAYFYSTRLLLAFDVDYHSAVTDAANIPTLGAAFQKNAVFDYAAGAEYYLTPSIPVRVGWFTNFDARPQLSKNEVGQRDHIDYNGESIFLAWVQPNSQIGAGFVFQQGWGDAQKIGGSAVIQQVAASSLTFAFSATHSL